MRDLYFHATAANPKVAHALMAQTLATLRPFRQYLDQAIRTAEQRQFRCELAWTRAERLQTLTLTPLQTRLRLPASPQRYGLHGWPSEQPLPLHRPVMVVNRSTQVTVVAAERVDEAVLVQVQGYLVAGDQLFWDGRPCQLAVVHDQPPQDLQTKDGQALAPLRPPVRSDDGLWLVDVEGRWSDQDLQVDGVWLAAQALPAGQALRQLRAADGAVFTSSGLQLRTTALPTSDTLIGDDGLRYSWRASKGNGHRGQWLQLELPERLDGDASVDPRAAFCEGEVKDVWTERRHHPSTTLRVFQVDRENYQLMVERLPEPGRRLYLPIDKRNLYLQKRAIRQLTDMPLPHLQGLLRLCEDPAKVRWPQPSRVTTVNWKILTALDRDGTQEQREFVCKALATPDIAMLEGPPGSGKTTAICELVLQLVARGERVLLCGSTHASIDNVLERLADQGAVCALRIGKPDKVDSRVADRVLDKQIEALVESWSGAPAFAALAPAELRDMAERAVVEAANLTCATTMGVAQHPLLRDREHRQGDRPLTTFAHFDVLIVDEASKTLIQEFLVPAMLARRWIIVGDVQQLPPFSDREDIVASLRNLVDADGRPVLDDGHQRACLLMFRLLDRDRGQPGLRWLIGEKASCLDHLAREMVAQNETSRRQLVRIVARAPNPEAPVPEVSVAQLQNGDPRAAYTMAADWLLVATELLPQVQALLPAHLLLPSNGPASQPWLPECSPFWFRQQWQLQQAPRLQRPYFDGRNRRTQIDTRAACQIAEQAWLGDPSHDWANEVAWRISSLHSLKRATAGERRERLNREIWDLLPECSRAGECVAEIEDIGLPSILEVLQEGIGRERSNRLSALTVGLKASREQDFSNRFCQLTFQHRMGPEIAEFPRKTFYRGGALRDANTIAERDHKLGWNFGTFPKRRVWLDVVGREDHSVNQDEVRAIWKILRDFKTWAQSKGPPLGDPSKCWQVACLAFYVKQEKALADMVREWTGVPAANRFALPDAPVEIVCATVDRFQGREADLVLLSMRNTGRVGFLDSPNRLNVAVTRARQQLVIVGNARYFVGCRTLELEQLAKETHWVPGTGAGV